MSNLILLLIFSISPLFTFQREDIITASYSNDLRGDIVIAFGNDYYIDTDLPTETDIINYIKIKRPDVFMFVGHVPLPRWETQSHFNTLPSTTFVTGVFYQEEHEDFNKFYQFIKESGDSNRWNMKTSYSSLLVKAPANRFPIGRYVKIIMLDLELEFSASSGKKELEWLDRELSPDSSIVMYLIVSNLQIFSLGKLYEIEITPEIRHALMTRFMKVNQPILFASTTGFGPYGEINNYPCEDMYRKVVEVSSRGMNAELVPKFDIINKAVVPEITSKKKDRVFVNNYGMIDVHLDVMNLDYSYVMVRLLSETNEVLLSQRLEFRDLRKDLKKPFENLKCTKDLEATVNKRIALNMMKNPYFWMSVMSLFLPFFLMFVMWKTRLQGGIFGPVGFGGGVGGGYGESSGGGFGWGKSEFEAYHGAY
jgi:hypothetical protein